MICKKLLVAFTLILAVLPVSAQLIPFSLEVRAGGNLTNMHTKDYMPLDKKISYRVEVVGDYKFAPFMFLRSGVTFSGKNAKISDRGFGDANGDGYFDMSETKGTIKARYVQMPLMVGTKFSIPFLFSVNAAVGGYAAYGLGGKYNLRTYIASSSIPIEQEKPTLIESNFPTLQSHVNYGKTFDDVYKRFDGGLIFSAGIEYHRITLNAGYEYGLVNMMKKGNAKVKNRNLFVTLGFRIL